MLRNITLFLLTLAVGGAVAIGGWWTLFLRERFGDNQAEIARRVAQIEQLSDDVRAKGAQIDQLSDDVRAKGQRIEELDADVRAKARKIDELDAQVTRLETSVRLLKIDHRVAEIEVLSQEPDPERPDHTVSRVRFVEYDDDGAPLGEGRVVEVPGKTVYVETLVVKFDDSLVEAGDPLRGTSVCLFRRIFGEDQEPSEGTPLDPVGAQPLVYGGDATPDSALDDLWKNFWDIANDPEAAHARGVRAMHGEAPFMQLRPGKRYRLELRASGGLTIRPEP